MKLKLDLFSKKVKTDTSSSSDYKTDTSSSSDTKMKSSLDPAPQPATAIDVPSESAPKPEKAVPIETPSSTPKTTQSASQNTQSNVSDTASVISASKDAGNTIADWQNIQSDYINNNILGYEIPEFSSEWDPLTREAVNNVLNMKYSDWLTSDQYKALEDRYQYLGNRSMQDTLGQVSARTGGLASSYAGSVAQQTYDDYMTQLQDVAMNAYQQERSNQIQNAELVASMSDRDYQRYTDGIALQMQKMGYDLEAINQMISTLDNERAFAYQQERDAIADSQWRETFDYQKVRDEIGDAQWDKEFGFSQDQFEWTKYMDQENLGLATKQFERAIFESDRDYEYNTGNDQYDRTLEMCMYTGDFSAMGELSGDYKWSKAQIKKANKMFDVYRLSGSSGGSGGRRGYGRRGSGYQTSEEKYGAYTKEGSSVNVTSKEYPEANSQEYYDQLHKGAYKLNNGVTNGQMSNWWEDFVAKNKGLSNAERINLALALGLVSYDELDSISDYSRLSDAEKQKIKKKYAIDSVAYSGEITRDFQ